MVVEGLRTFRPDAEHNPGRMNFFSIGDVSVVIDLAHNEAGLEALLEIMNGVRRPGARLLLALGAVGDRQDDLIEKLGEIGARDSDLMVIAHKDRYLRGRPVEELDGLMRAGAERVGVTDVESYPTEVSGLAALVEQAQPGDVVALMCHAEREAVYDWLAEHGGVPDSPETLAAQGAGCRGAPSPAARPWLGRVHRGVRAREGTDVQVALDHPGRFRPVAPNASRGARSRLPHGRLARPDLHGGFAVVPWSHRRDSPETHHESSPTGRQLGGAAVRPSDADRPAPAQPDLEHRRPGAPSAEIPSRADRRARRCPDALDAPAGHRVEPDHVSTGSAAGQPSVGAGA